MNGLFFGLLTIIACLLTVFAAVKLRRKRKWPTAEGTITKGTVLEGSCTQGAELEYSFSLSEQTYTGTYVDLVSFPHDYVGKWRPGSKVIVRYKPRNPKISFLTSKDNPGIEWGTHFGPENLIYCRVPWKLKSDYWNSVPSILNTDGGDNARNGTT